jgi:flagellar motor switch protein FliN/FliY
MPEEEKKNQQENEDIMQAWEEALKEQKEQEQAQQGQEQQEDIMQAWEEALKEQQAQQQEEQQEQQEDIMQAWEEALKEQEKQESQEEPAIKDEKIELLKDIPLEITVEVGSTHLSLEEILKLHPNSVIELDRFIDEPVDIKINGKLVAKGQLYTVKENFGIKITQIITPEERIKLIEEE